MGDKTRREAVIDRLSDSMIGTYDCTRVWEAWSYGTMHREDFVPVDERIEEIADEVLSAVNDEPLITLIKRFVALPGGAWHQGRYEAEKAQLMQDAADILAAVEKES